MTSLENLARLKNLALAEDAKNKGGYNGSQYKAWNDYHDAINACSAYELQQVAKALQTLSNFQDYSNAFNSSAVHAFLDTNPQYYHGLDSALQFARLAIESLEAEMAKRNALRKNA